jgi:hypothetical protein
LLRPNIYKTYVASINGNAVLAFRAEDDDQARAIIDDPEGSMRSDLLTLIGADGKPLWDGKSAIQAREATPAQHAEWQQSREQWGRLPSLILIPPCHHAATTHFYFLGPARGRTL